MKYTKVDQLSNDLEYMRENPNDLQFFESVLQKYDRSSGKMKQAVKGLLYERLLDSNPNLVLKAVAVDNPQSFVVCKSPSDPFFEV